MKTSPSGWLKKLSYPKLVALGYFAIIMLGTALLCLPFAARSGQPTPFLDALFTSTSATCVTGLIVVDTFLNWTLFGQIVILVLIQIGGLGFMTIITLFWFLLRRKIGLRARGLLRESVNTQYVGGIVRLFKKILIGTAVFEGAGFILLSSRFVPALGWAEGLWCGLFHSVSAFCNAGFDLMGRYGEFSSLTAWNSDPTVLITIMALIVIGGIGFFVWDDVMEHKLRVNRYAVHTKIVLSVTGILILAGAALFLAMEWDSTLAGMETGDKVLNAVFCSVTPRTAGFNSVSNAQLEPASKLLTMAFMFIGGSPGSTAGGIKTTTLAVVLISAMASLRRSRSENVFRRRLEEDAIRKASSVILINAALAILAVLLTCAVQPELALTDTTFEALSAVGTVGLTTGITTSLGVVGRLCMILLMYCGRVGSLSFALMFTDSKQPAPVTMPEAKINIG